LEEPLAKQQGIGFRPSSALSFVGGQDSAVLVCRNESQLPCQRQRAPAKRHLWAQYAMGCSDASLIVINVFEAFSNLR